MNRDCNKDEAGEVGGPGFVSQPHTETPGTRELTRLYLHRLHVHGFPPPASRNHLFLLVISRLDLGCGGGKDAPWSRTVPFPERHSPAYAGTTLIHGSGIGPCQTLSPKARPPNSSFGGNGGQDWSSNRRKSPEPLNGVLGPRGEDDRKGPVRTFGKEEGRGRIKKHVLWRRGCSQHKQVTSHEDLPVPMENPFKEPLKKCILCGKCVDYKNVQLLSQFISPFTGCIYGRHITGLCGKKQKEISKAIKRAQIMGFMPVTYKDPAYRKDPKICNIRYRE